MFKDKSIKIFLFFIVVFFSLFILFNILNCCRYEIKNFNYNSNEVQVIFKGEVSNNQIFGQNKSITNFVMPIDKFGDFEGKYFNETPNWLNFQYEINGIKKTVLIAKEPILNFVSWDALARGGLVFGDDSIVYIDDEGFAQNSRIIGVDGSVYSVRLLDCGGYTMDNLSEWNLLIGGVHEGDVDFNGEAFGWINNPYSDKDLKIGFNGSLNWCQNEWSKKENYKVNRGYFFASRFHATQSSFLGERIFWRPVLELIDDYSFNDLIIVDNNLTKLVDLKDSYQKINFIGEIKDEEIFGEDNSIINYFKINEGVLLVEKPNWLKFEIDDKEILVAKKPILRSISWDTLFNEGLIFGSHKINANDGSVYSVRLLDCGGYTMDNLSEWNLLIGGVHEGDGDFNNLKFNKFSNAKNIYGDEDLQIGLDGFGTSTWCKNAKLIDNKLYAVNRGYFTVSRFHLTETSFTGNAFSWRPVLEKEK